MIFALDKVKNIVGKFSQDCFQKAFSSGLLKVGIVW